MIMREDLADAVREVQAGNAAAYGVVVEACWDRLVRFARSIVGEADAEDVVQESLVAAWRALRFLKDRARFDRWITSIVFHRCLRKRRWWRLRVALDDVHELAVRSDPAPDLDVEALLGRLAPRQRAVMHLTVVEGMTDAEIAASLSMTAGTVRAHRRRARATLARLMERTP
jgi:RNA polymerase sigma-70 factor (ECF subfamily)